MSTKFIAFLLFALIAQVILLCVHFHTAKKLQRIRAGYGPKRLLIYATALMSSACWMLPLYLLTIDLFLVEALLNPEPSSRMADQEFAMRINFGFMFLILLVGGLGLFLMSYVEIRYYWLKWKKGREGVETDS